MKKRGDVMDRGDLLFRKHLNFQIETQSDEDNEKEVELDDIKSIDLHHCSFSDFKRALTYARNNYPEYYFSDTSLDSIKPSDSEIDKKHDYITLSEHASRAAISIGNMTLFNELQKITSAARVFNVNSTGAEILEDSTDYSMESFLSIDSPNIYEELGSCVIGGGSADTYKLTAYFHDSSRKERPIIAVHSYSINTNSYLPNIDIIDVSNIYKPNASLMEAFAYMCYEDHRKKSTSLSFDKLLISGNIDIDELDDMYSKHYDLRIYDRTNREAGLAGKSSY